MDTRGRRLTSRATGGTPVTAIDNVDAPLTETGTRFCPGVNGGTEWNGPAFSPQTNTFYVSSVGWCTTVRVSAEKLRNVKGLPWTGSAERFVPFGTNDTTWRGWLTAVDADDGRVRWRYESATPLVAVGAGMHSPVAWKLESEPARIAVFGLP